MLFQNCFSRSTSCKHKLQSTLPRRQPGKDRMEMEGTLPHWESQAWMVYLNVSIQSTGWKRERIQGCLDDKKTCGGLPASASIHILKLTLISRPNGSSLDGVSCASPGEVVCMKHWHFSTVLFRLLFSSVWFLLLFPLPPSLNTAHIYPLKPLDWQYRCTPNYIRGMCVCMSACWCKE